MNRIIYRKSKFPHQSDKRDYSYFNAKKKKIALDTNTEEYIKSLKIPPAYQNVKINLNQNSKI